MMSIMGSCSVPEWARSQVSEAWFPESRACPVTPMICAYEDHDIHGNAVAFGEPVAMYR